MLLEDFLTLLENPRKSGGQYIARCPAHDDKDPSLSVAERDGKILVHCHANCTSEAICGALHIGLKDLFADSGNGNGHRAAANNGTNAESQAKAKFAGTDEIVDEMRAALARSPECLRYIESRGISLKLAGEYRWGFDPYHRFTNDEGRPVRLAARVSPHYDSRKELVGLQFRTIDGTKRFDQLPGSVIHGLYGVGVLDRAVPEILVLEGPEDTALAATHGFNAIGLLSASSKVLPADVKTLTSYPRVYLVGDQDLPGQKLMDSVAAQLPAEKVIRVRFPAYKDIGDLWKADPPNFKQKLRQLLRFAQAQGSREYFDFADLLDEEEIGESFESGRDAVERLVPCNGVSMFFGEEKGGKSLLARYIGKCVANGLQVFGKYRTTKMPVVCLDLENATQDLRDFTRHFSRLGPEKIRYWTRKTAVPALDSPSLLRLCERDRPLIIVDSMTKFLETNKSAFDPVHMSAFFDKLLNLCAAGATIILIHHATRGDVERYADSHQIGANVARSFAVVSLDRPKLNRVRLEGQLFRGGEPITENLIAFPLIAEEGMFGLSSDPLEAELQALAEFVRSQPGQCCSKETIKTRRGRRAEGNLELLRFAVERGILTVRKDRKVAFPDSGTVESEPIPFPTTGTYGNGGGEL